MVTTPAPNVARYRLAFRVEGRMWNAYFARGDTMDGAILLGSIAMTAVMNKARKNAFVGLMQCALETSLADDLEVVRWEDPVSAPPHERTGSA